MKINVNEDFLQSREYRKLFQFIKKEGIDPFLSLMDDIEALKRQDLIQDAIIRGTHPTLSLARKHRDVIQFLRKVDRINLPSFLNDPVFRSFLDGIDMSKINMYYDRAALLEELKIGNIVLIPEKIRELTLETAVYYDKKGFEAVSKCYGNGDVRYSYDRDNSCYGVDCYRTYVKFPNTNSGIVLKTDNHKDGSQFRYAYLKNFNFSAYDLPTDSELSRFDVPLELEGSAVYVKRKKN